MVRQNISLRGNGSWLVMVDVFLTLAEAGGSIQAKLAKEELKKLTDTEKTEIENDTSLINFNSTINSALMNAVKVCNEKRKDVPADKNMSYGSDIIIHHHPVVYAHERLLTYGSSVLQFIWLAHDRFERSNKTHRDQYVDIWLGRADSEIEVNGRISNIAELFNRSRVFETISKWEIFNPIGQSRRGQIDVSQLGQERISFLPRQKEAI